MPDWLVTLLAAVLMSIPGWYAAFFRQPLRDRSTIRKEYAEAEKVEEETRMLAQERAERLDKTIAALEERMSQLEVENAELHAQIVLIQSENKSLREEIYVYQDCAERLVSQGRSLSCNEPVKMAKRRHDERN